MMGNKRIVILGGGNVGSHLARACSSLSGYTLVQHYERKRGMELSDIVRDADLYLFALTDTALPEVWREMPQTTGVWIHLSGSTPLEAMAAYHDRSAVLYPLQTFSRDRAISWKKIPLYYEGDKEAQLLAEALSDHVAPADSLGRRKLHLAAVLACNFSNFLVTLAEEYLATEGFDPKALLPLLSETFAKLEQMPAAEAQTGPAIRGDEAIIKRHEEMLSGDTLEVYSLLSRLLLARYKDKQTKNR